MLTCTCVCFTAALAVIACLAHGNQQNAANFTFWNPSFRKQRISIDDFAARFYAVGSTNNNKEFNPIQLPAFTKQKLFCANMPPGSMTSEIAIATEIRAVGFQACFFWVSPSAVRVKAHCLSRFRNGFFSLHTQLGSTHS